MKPLFKSLLDFASDCMLAMIFILILFATFSFTLSLSPESFEKYKNQDVLGAKSSNQFEINPIKNDNSFFETNRIVMEKESVIFDLNIKNTLLGKSADGLVEITNNSSKVEKVIVTFYLTAINSPKIDVGFSVEDKNYSLYTGSVTNTINNYELVFHPKETVTINLYALSPEVQEVDFPFQIEIKKVSDQ